MDVAVFILKAKSILDIIKHIGQEFPAESALKKEEKKCQGVRLSHLVFPEPASPGSAVGEESWDDWGICITTTGATTRT